MLQVELYESTGPAKPPCSPRLFAVRCLILIIGEPPSGDRPFARALVLTWLQTCFSALCKIFIYQPAHHISSYVLFRFVSSLRRPRLCSPVFDGSPHIYSTDCLPFNLLCCKLPSFRLVSKVYLSQSFGRHTQSFHPLSLAFVSLTISIRIRSTSTQHKITKFNATRPERASFTSTEDQIILLC